MNTGNTFFNGVVHFNLEIIILNIKKNLNKTNMHTSTVTCTHSHLFLGGTSFLRIYVDLFLLDYQLIVLAYCIFEYHSPRCCTKCVFCKWGCIMNPNKCKIMFWFLLKCYLIVHQYKLMKENMFKVNELHLQVHEQCTIVTDERWSWQIIY